MNIIVSIFKVSFIKNMNKLTLIDIIELDELA